uniref:Uncharacterized protein n=1 Tax=Oryza meridionalis TaxID=40149 RepID=A0A0E0C0C0_9ORYZ
MKIKIKIKDMFVANRTEAITVGELFAQLGGSNYDSLAFTVARGGFDRRQGGDCVRPRTSARKQHSSHGNKY